VIDSAHRLERLRAIPLFADLDEAALERIASVATEFEAPAGHVLVQPYDAGSGMFVIEEGTVIVEAPRKTLELGPGEFLGELSLLVPDSTRIARVRAGTPIRCVAIARKDFDRMLADEPRIAISMLRVLARRLAAAMQD
jgi:CRP-like cAMP-binding protein